jgi:hypothetical protein
VEKCLIGLLVLYTSQNLLGTIFRVTFTVFYRRIWSIVGKYSILCCDNVHVPSQPPSEVPDPHCQNEVIQLRGDNKLLREHLSELNEQYYQWKVACILTVDKNWQMAIEMDKINKEYKQHNMMRDFGLTSWAHTDDMFLGMRFQQRE